MTMIVPPFQIFHLKKTPVIYYSNRTTLFQVTVNITVMEMFDSYMLFSIIMYNLSEDTEEAFL